VHLLGLLVRCNSSSSNSPNWLVSNNNVVPVLLLKNLGDSSKLLLDELDVWLFLALGLAFTNLERLADAKDDTKTTVKSSSGLGGDGLVRLAKESTALRVADDDPLDANIGELLDRDLASVCALLLVKDVLSGDGNIVLADEVTGVGEIEGWWCKDNLYCGVLAGA
jgi:hypothetical protein